LYELMVVVSLGATVSKHGIKIHNAKLGNAVNELIAHVIYSVL